MSSREPGTVRIMISRGDDMKDIINTNSKRAKWGANDGGNDGYEPNDPLRRRRPRTQEGMYPDYNPAYPPQTPHRMANPLAMGMNPQTPDFMHPGTPGFTHSPPYPAAVVPQPQQRSWLLSACVMFFVVMLAVVVGAVIAILLFAHLPVSE